MLVNYLNNFNFLQIVSKTLKVQRQLRNLMWVLQTLICLEIRLDFESVFNNLNYVDNNVGKLIHKKLISPPPQCICNWHISRRNYNNVSFLQEMIQYHTDAISRRLKLCLKLLQVVFETRIFTWTKINTVYQYTVLWCQLKIHNCVEIWTCCRIVIETTTRFLIQSIY